MTLPPHRKQEIRARYLEVDTANVADVLDELGYPDYGLSSAFWPIREGSKLAGWAYTVRGQMTPYPGSGDPAKMEAVSGLEEGEVSVWSGGGAEGVCFFGELIALGMRERGCAGALIDGGIRDIRWINEMQFPVFTRYRTPVQSIGRWQVNAWQVPVYLPGATAERVVVRPGDFILADFDGAIVIPAELAETVLERAEALTQKERLIREDLRQGASLPEVLAKYGHV
ncbi:regulator of RNase E activity RraA [Deinobacterium chartae]|uniref:Regulator of ribonuclease activity homolog n=1 Tax=Deinobacterium chartae TaxID=521158 RepID=A0A841HYM8_9DEIO|nr:RraA family protein [Deinobacterium chartae]MBB6097330.1 regulator of RNase E activity RraA [Deinobacterium chartae]